MLKPFPGNMSGRKSRIAISRSDLRYYGLLVASLGLFRFAVRAGLSMRTHAFWTLCGTAGVSGYSNNLPSEERDRGELRRNTQQSVCEYMARLHVSLPPSTLWPNNHQQCSEHGRRSSAPCSSAYRYVELRYGYDRSGPDVMQYYV
ncbi:hypothetical protein BU23DRAFT_316242 [Bimuria novae-zelandiae CBS 107.79]|uniref:Uncharacterized protein n=1 Tax=Bimuria novae-zelandiae CBS 107.79 TaxID=1447943 RepID=A0A6A5UQ61_9PLEO|nr:hypothetical protein BU23DRAFT_316242 [Bimuria novae-zelandiae CBS 107.79]